jgi:hypothetical protein
MVDVHQEEGEGMIFQSLPRDFVLEVVQEEASVVDTGEFILKDEPGRVFAHMLKKMEKFFVFHFTNRRSSGILMLPYLFSFKQLGFQILRLSSSILDGRGFFKNDGGSGLVDDLFTRLAAHLVPNGIHNVTH